MANWVIGHPGSAEPGPAPRVAGAAPNQDRLAVEPPAAPPYGTAEMLLGAFGLAAAGYLAGPVSSRLARRRGGARLIDPAMPEQWPQIRRLLRLAAAAGISSTVLMNLLIGLVVAFVLLDAGSGPVAHGGWFLVRLAALATVVLEVASVDTTISSRRAGWRPSLAHAAAVIGVIAATGIVLVVDAYMGVFAPRW
jgi:hypothetical protein